MAEIFEFQIFPEIQETDLKPILANDISSVDFSVPFAAVSETERFLIAGKNAVVLRFVDYDILKVILDKRKNTSYYPIVAFDLIDRSISSPKSAVSLQAYTLAKGNICSPVYDAEAQAKAVSDEVNYRDDINYSSDYPDIFPLKEISVTDLYSADFSYNSYFIYPYSDYLAKSSDAYTEGKEKYFRALGQRKLIEKELQERNCVDLWKFPSISFVESYVEDSIQDFNNPKEQEDNERFIFEGELKLIKGTTDFYLEYAVKNPVTNIKFRLPDGIDWDTTISLPDNVEIDWNTGIINLKVMGIEPVRFILKDKDGNKFYVKIKLDYSQAFLVARR